MEFQLKLHVPCDADYPTAGIREICDTGNVRSGLSSAIRCANHLPLISVVRIGCFYCMGITSAVGVVSLIDH